MITEEAFAKAAADLDAPVAYVKAVAAVESPTGGFDSKGQPFILFEAHRFAKLTGGTFNNSDPDISSATWNRALYARGPNVDARNTGEHARLAKAVRLNRRAALMATSWGRFQILGENYASCGFEELQDFINAMYESEDAQLAAFVEFIQSDKRKADALKAGDWATLARLYNGSAYRENKYDTKLAAAAKAAT
jgi:hypothetical protein